MDTHRYILTFPVECDSETPYAAITRLDNGVDLTWNAYTTGQAYDVAAALGMNETDLAELRRILALANAALDAGLRVRSITEE